MNLISLSEVDLAEIETLLISIRNMLVSLKPKPEALLNLPVIIFMVNCSPSEPNPVLSRSSIQRL